MCASGMGHVLVITSYSIHYTKLYETLGSPISMIVRNMDAISKSYEDIKDIYRPGHADFTYDQKYGFRDP